MWLGALDLTNDDAYIAVEAFVFAGHAMHVLPVSAVAPDRTRHAASDERIARLEPAPRTARFDANHAHMTAVDPATEAAVALDEDGTRARRTRGQGAGLRRPGAVASR
ncbi:hypothetical protein [Glycomyces tenuis]|uniref:hypothetical protein n=1 Tax=Glycomyces tenuis TaxID=58116 RepID=UPI0003F70DBD|nr:hypothetical protein [Glycomyces tenuis]